MQSEVMKFDPATGEPMPYPSHAEQWRKWHGHSCAWLFNPWTGGRRDARDVGGDTNGRLIAPPGTLGSDLGVETVPDNTANAAWQTYQAGYAAAKAETAAAVAKERERCAAVCARYASALDYSGNAYVRSRECQQAAAAIRAGAKEPSDD